ncbi:hypothetical protein Tco_1412682, partial [Tanacetum coccineum]
PPPAYDSEAEAKAETEAEAEAKAEVAPIPPPVPANPIHEAVPIGTSRLIPFKRLFTNTQHIEEEDVRADNKRLKMMLDCSENRTRDAWREHDRATWHYHHLRRWSIMVNNLLPLRLRYQEPPYALPKTLLALATHIDPRDPYVAARDVATAPSTDTDDSLTEKETSPSEPQGSPPRDS